MYVFGTQKKERISTTIPRQLADEARKKGIKFSYALAEGLKRILCGDQVVAEEKEHTNKKIEKMSQRIATLSERIWRMQEEKEGGGDIT